MQSSAGVVSSCPKKGAEDLQVALPEWSHGAVILHHPLDIDEITAAKLGTLGLAGGDGIFLADGGVQGEVGADSDIDASVLGTEDLGEAWSGKREGFGRGHGRRGSGEPGRDGGGGEDDLASNGDSLSDGVAGRVGSITAVAAQRSVCDHAGGLCVSVCRGRYFGGLQDVEDGVDGRDWAWGGDERGHDVDRGDGDGARGA